MVDHFSAYIYQKRGFYYFSRRVPKQLQHCHSKQRIVLAPHGFDAWQKFNHLKNGFSFD